MGSLARPARPLAPQARCWVRYDPVALKLQSYFPAATAPGWIPGCPGPVNASASYSANLQPTALNNYVFNGSSPNTDNLVYGQSRLQYFLDAETLV